MKIEYIFHLTKNDREFLRLNTELPFAPMIGDLILDADFLFEESLKLLKDYGVDGGKISTHDIILFDSGTRLCDVLDMTYRVYERVIFGNTLMVRLELDIDNNKLSLLDIAEMGKVNDSIDFSNEYGYNYFVDFLNNYVPAS